MTGLFDGLIGEAKDLLSPFPCRPLPTGRPAREGDPNQLLLRRDTAYELGEGSFPSVSFTAVTQDIVNDIVFHFDSRVCSDFGIVIEESVLVAMNLAVYDMYGKRTLHREIAVYLQRFIMGI